MRSGDGCGSGRSRRGQPIPTRAAGNAPQDDWKPRRLGANPPASEVELLGRAFVEVASACGCPAVLFAETGDGTSRREAFRQFLHTTLQPLAELIAEELSIKLGAAVTLNLVLRHVKISG